MNPGERSAMSVAESQAPDTAQALETGDAGVAPGQTCVVPDWWRE